MSRPGLFKLMSQDWKKSSIYLTVGGSSIWFLYDYIITNDVLKSNCRLAAAYGDERLTNPGSHIRHITVILNPVACKRKSRKLYTKWVEPLLHLAGIKVSLIETESVNQAFDLMKIMSNCDGVAIVGGDGTVHEALNGLLSRPDCAKAASNIPIAIIPAGQNNSIARYIHQNSMRYRNQKEFLVGSTMQLIESTMQKFDVIKITPVGPCQTNDSDALEPNKQDTSSPIYALRDLRYGIYQDNFFKVSGYYSYQTFIKPLWLRIQRAFSSSGKYPAPKIESLAYTAPCEGCSTCYEKHRLRDNQPVGRDEPSVNRKWWSMVAPVKSNAPSEEEKEQLKRSKRDNPNCQKWVSVGNLEDVSDFRACMMGDKKVRLSLGRHREYTPSDVTEVQDIRLRLKPELDAVKSQASQTDEKMDLDDRNPVQFLVDGHPTQARSLEITAIEKAITVFTGPYKIPPVFNTVRPL